MFNSIVASVQIQNAAAGVQAFPPQLRDAVERFRIQIAGQVPENNEPIPE